MLTDILKHIVALLDVHQLQEKRIYKKIHLLHTFSIISYLSKANVENVENVEKKF